MSINQLGILGTQMVLGVGAFGLIILSLMLLVETVAALFPSPPLTKLTAGQDVKMAVLIPAHNEELGIHTTVTQLVGELTPPDRLIVVADNCTDATAAIARTAGATVIERFDSERRGKGYALDYGLRYLASEPPDVVVLVDADCQVEAGVLGMLKNSAIATGRPIQATYLLTKPTQPTPKDSVSTFAFKVKNLVRPQGLTRLGIPCLLTGTGMAFKWDVINSVNLASGHLVEDMKLGLDLTIAGHKPLLCQEAHVSGTFPQQAQATNTQRTRWEHGHLQTIRQYVPKLAIAAVQQQRWDLLLSALDLCIPPLSLLVTIWATFTLGALLAATMGAGWLPVILCATAGGVLLSAILTAWAKFGQQDLPLVELLTIPLYILWKIPLYFKFVVQPQTAWVRTQRDSK